MADIEHDVKVIPIDDNLQATVKKLEGEGWNLMPGVLPVAVYHVVRMKGKPLMAQSAIGTLGVDDAKVHVLRDGKLVN